MMKAEQLYYSNKADLNLEVQIIVEPLGAMYRLVYRLVYFLRKSREESKSSASKAGLLIVEIIPTFVYWLVHFLIIIFLSPALVEEFIQDVIRISETGNRGYCGLIIAYQKSEDVDDVDQWMGLIRTLQQDIKG